MTDSKMSDSEHWDIYIGNQTPDEFMVLSDETESGITPEEAVHQYLVDTNPAMCRDELVELRDSLVRYIEWDRRVTLEEK